MGPSGYVSQILGHGFHLIGWVATPWVSPGYKGESVLAHTEAPTLALNGS